MQIENFQSKQASVPGIAGVADAALDSVKDPSLKTIQTAPQSDHALKRARNALVEAMDIAKERLEGTGLNVRLKTGLNTERFQVEVFDPKTKEVLRRFPPDEIIRLAESIEEMAGLIVDRTL